MIPASHRLPPFNRRPVVARVMAGLLLCFQAAWGQGNIITNVADVRALSSTETAKAHPVRLRGVVIDRSEPREHAVTVADDTGGLYALARTNLFAPYQRGALLELTGVTDPGEFAPIVKVSAVHKLGTAPLPEPRPVSYHQLISGALDAQWVEIRGVVQQYLPSATGSEIRRMMLSTDGGLVHVRLTDPHDPNLQEDAEVRVWALCFYQSNQKRQLLNPILSVPSGIPIIVEKPAPADPFAAPVHSADSLLLFSPDQSIGHRVHMRGVITHNQAGSPIWMRDESAGLRLQARAIASVQPGDFVDVLGFPKFGSATPVLEDAIFVKLGTTNPPAPRSLTNSTDAFNHENDLVSIEALLTEVAPVQEGVALTLETSGTVFKATMKLPAGSVRQLPWQPGSWVRVAGICSVTYDETRPLMGLWHPQSFQLLLRSPGDLKILQPPSWWNLRHISYLLGIASCVLLLAISGVALLARRRLREQRQNRAMAEAEFAAILSERNRMAREIHDTLAQGLTATSFQLRLVKKFAPAADEPLNQHLDAAQELVRGSLAEARNSIWNMRSHVLETHDLPRALENILKQMADGAGCQTAFKVTGQARRLAPVIENNLLRVGQEAITNAVRHAQAGQIIVELNFTEKQFRLSIQDDGCGFDAAHLQKSNGGFGLVGMRERAKEMNGEFEVRSHPGKGTQIFLAIPLSG